MTRKLFFRSFRYTQAEIINSGTYLIEHKSNTSLPNETPSAQSTFCSQCHHNKTVTDTINLGSLENYNPEPVDQFIDYLIDSKATVIPGEKETSLNLINTLRSELEKRNLPIVNFVSSDGNPCKWPEFMADFKSIVHIK